MSWWSKIFGKEPPKPREAPRAVWVPADQNRHGVPVLDLFAVTGQLLSTTSDPKNAATAISWASKLVADLELTLTPAESLACELRYPAEHDLPDGWLYVPSQMEEKWAIAYRGAAIYLIRSWTGDVKAAGRVRRDGDEIVVECVELSDGMLRMFGDPIETFDWILRAHALGQQVPLPIASDTAPMLEAAPLSVFSPFGHVAKCAATSWSPPPPQRPLRSTGDVVTAVREEDEARLRALVAGGASLGARSAVLGYTALHVAVVKGSVALTRLLLELGADPNVLADRDACVLITAVVHRAPIEVLELLAKHGAIATPNADGFGLLHAIAETDRPEYLEWGLARGLDLEARTKHGHTPLQVAAGLGHVAALRALLAAGADRAAK
ncbi:MAG TPA: ankyrin repeat domain-containing protein, partial [Kofleriaceae bacterium]